MNKIHVLLEGRYDDVIAPEKSSERTMRRLGSLPAMLSWKWQENCVMHWNRVSRRHPRKRKRRTEKETQTVEGKDWKNTGTNYREYDCHLETLQENFYSKTDKDATFYENEGGMPCANGQMKPGYNLQLAPKISSSAIRN